MLSSGKVSCIVFVMHVEYLLLRVMCLGIQLSAQQSFSSTEANIATTNIATLVVLFLIRT